MDLLSFGAPWDCVKMKQDHVVETVDLIHTAQCSCLQALCSLRACLHDGQNENWHSDEELQCKRNMDISAKTNKGRVPGSPGDDIFTLRGSSGHCNKCGTNLHAGGKDQCPWNAMSASMASKNANKCARATWPDLLKLQLLGQPHLNQPILSKDRQEETRATGPLKDQRSVSACNCLCSDSDTLASSQMVLSPHF